MIVHAFRLFADCLLGRLPVIYLTGCKNTWQQEVSTV